MQIFPSDGIVEKTRKIHDDYIHDFVFDDGRIQNIYLLDKSTPMGAILDQLERAKASIRAKVEHPFRVIKRQFGHVKVRYRGLAKNTAQLHTLFALSNLWMVRRTLLQEMRG